MRARGGLAPIIVVFVLHHLQNQMMRPYVPLYAASIDVGLLGIGVVAAAIALVPIFAALPVGSLADRWGIRPMIVLGSVLSGLSYLVLLLAGSFAVIVASQLVAGFANLLIILAAQAYVGSLGQGVIAERNFATYTIFASIGQIAGPLGGGVLISALGFPAAFATSSTLSLLCLVAAFALLPRPIRRDAPPTAGPGFPRRALGYLAHPPTRLAILASCLMSVPEILRTSFLPIYLGAVVQLDTALVGYVLALFSVAGLAAKLVLPRIVARFGRQVMLMLFTTVCALTVAALPLTASIVVVSAIVIVMGLTFGLGRPLSMAMAANSAAPEDIGLVVGLRLAGNRTADFLLPLGFGGIAALGGIGFAFLGGGGLMLLGAVFLIRPTIAEIRDRRAGDGR